MFTSSHSWFQHLLCLLLYGRHLWYRNLYMTPGNLYQRGATCARCGYHVEDCE